jgi:virginiamycin A acetyltransferase
MNGPDPRTTHPMTGFPRVCFVKNTVSNPNLEIGDFTYYDDPDDSEDFERNVLYHYPFIGDKLIIGKFCAIAQGVKFIMNGANHKTSGFSSFPFSIFGNGWERVVPEPGELPYKGDTIIGNDVWLGYESVIMPGTRIGHGAIIASKSVVTGRVPPYCIYAGNPAQQLMQRFSTDTIAALLEIAWWDWDIAKITRNLEIVVGADLEALRACD